MPQYWDFEGEIKHSQVETAENRENNVLKTDENQKIDQLAKEFREFRAEVRELLGKNQKIVESAQKTAENEQIIPIKEAIEGTWKMIDHMNFEKCEKKLKVDFKLFSENLRYDIYDGKLVQTGGGSPQLFEGSHWFDNTLFEEDDNCLTTDHDDDAIEEVLIQDGKLVRYNFFSHQACKRVYQKI